MDRVYQANAIETPPSSVASSGPYPTAGNKASGQLATVPGPYWFYSITEEIRNAIIAAGLTPDSAQVNQLATALAKFLPLSGGNVTGNLTVQSKHVVRSVNGTTADANGNVAISLVKSVNGTTADANGNVALGTALTFVKRASFDVSVAYKGTAVTKTITGLTPGSFFYLTKSEPDSSQNGTLRTNFTGLKQYGSTLTLGNTTTGSAIILVEGTTVTITFENPSTTHVVRNILDFYTT